jgi:uncharacterized OB-fold protein
LKTGKTSNISVEKLAGACNGLIHKKGETTPKKVKIEMKVKTVFKPSFERKASINDVRHSRSAE